MKLTYDITTNIVRRAQAMRTAERECSQFLDPGMTFDAAEDYYKAALTAMGFDMTRVHPSAYREIFRAHLKSGRRRAPADVSDYPSISRIQEL